MVAGDRLRRLTGAAVVCASVLAAPSGADEVVRFRQALEAYDYGRWREAALLLEAAATVESPDGSRGDVQAYGQRWVPFLPHHFLGSSLFEIGRYPEALAQWRLSRRQIESESPDAAGGLLRYSLRRLRELAPGTRLRQEIVPGALEVSAQRLAGLRVRVAMLAESVDALSPSERTEWVRLIGAHEDALTALGARRATLVAQLAEADAGVETGVLEGLAELVEILDRVSLVHAEITRLEAVVDEALIALRGLFIDGLGDGREPGRSPAAAFAVHRAQASRPSVAMSLAGRSPSGPTERCGYAAGDPEAWHLALSDYLVGTAIASTQGCREIRAVAVPRLQCALAAWPKGRQRPLDGRYSPTRSLSMAAARCGERDEARSWLDRHRQTATRPGPDPAVDVVVRWLDGEMAQYPGRSRAIVIGAWDYRDWPDLPGAKADYESLIEVLEEQGFVVEGVANPTRRDLDRLIEKLARQTRSGDRLALYYAGHGHLSRSEDLDLEVGWIVPVDAPASDATDFSSFAVSMDEVRMWSLFTLADVRQQLFVFDSCFAGQLFLDSDRSRRCRTGADGTGMDRRLALEFPFLAGASPGSVGWLERQPVKIWMSAGSAQQRVADRSRYSELLVRALSGQEPHADTDSDGYLLTDTELVPHLRQRARAETVQAPQAESLCGEGDFVFRISQGPALSPVELPEAQCGTDALATLEDVFRWEALSSVGGYSEYLDSSRCRIFEGLARMLARGDA